MFILLQEMVILPRKDKAFISRVGKASLLLGGQRASGSWFSQLWEASQQNNDGRQGASPRPQAWILTLAVSYDHMSQAGHLHTLLFSVGLLQGPCAYIWNGDRIGAQVLLTSLRKKYEDKYSTVLTTYISTSGSFIFFDQNFKLSLQWLRLHQGFCFLFS